MPKAKRKQITAVTADAASPKTSRATAKGRRTGIIIAAVLIPLILIVAFAVYYQVRFGPFQQPVLTVDTNVIRMDYFLKRAKMAGGDPTALLQQLVDEQLVKIMAPSFGITATQQEIDGALLTKGSTDNPTVNLSDNTSRYLTESEFKAWYSQQLATTRLSDLEYKDMARTNVLGAKLKLYLEQKVPLIGEQIHLNVIVVANSTDAAKAKARIKTVDDFTAVARDVSLDTQTKDKGGDLGWLPRGVLPYDDTTFYLSVGAVSEPIAVNPATPGSSQYLLFMVSEKSPSRVIDDSALQALKSRAFVNWSLQEAPSHRIVLNYDFSNAANIAWVNWQLTRVGK